MISFKRFDQHDRRQTRAVAVIEVLEPRWLFADGILAHPGPAIQGTAGVALENVVVATFEITDPSGAPGTQWNARIQWGDSSTASLRVPATALPDGTFEFLGTHAYTNAGDYTITVNIAVPGSGLPNDNTVTTSATISSAVSLQSIAVTPANPNVPVGLKQQFTATGTYSDNSTQDLSSQVAWGSDTPGVATINSTGLATAVGSGTSTISAELNGISGSTLLTTAPTIAGTTGDDQFYLQLSPDRSTLQVWNASAPVGAPTQSFAMANLAACDIETGDGNDTVTVDFSNGNPVPAGGMKFDGGSGTNTLIVKGSSGNDAFTASGGTISLGAGTITYVNVAQVDVDGGTGTDSLLVNSGAVNLGSLSNIALTVNGSGAANLLNSTTVTGLNIADSGKVKLAAGGGKALTIGPNATAASLNITGNGLLELNDNGLILQAGDAADRDGLLGLLSGLVKSVRGTNGAWAGTTGVTSSAAKADFAANTQAFTTGIAVSSNIKLDQNGNVIGPLKTTFKGQAVDQNAVLAAYSFNGDTNLDGVITFDDYFKINTGFLSNGAMKGYQNGDFTFDGLINFDDYFLINTAFLGQGSKVLPPMRKVVAPFSSKQIHRTHWSRRAQFQLRRRFRHQDGRN